MHMGARTVTRNEKLVTCIVMYRIAGWHHFVICADQMLYTYPIPIKSQLTSLESDCLTYLAKGNNHICVHKSAYLLKSRMIF